MADYKSTGTRGVAPSVANVAAMGTVSTAAADAIVVCFDEATSHLHAMAALEKVRVAILHDLFYTKTSSGVRVCLGSAGDEDPALVFNASPLSSVVVDQIIAYYDSASDKTELMSSFEKAKIQILDFYANKSS